MLKYHRPLLFLSALLCSSQLCAEDWPQWRGPGRDGVWKAQNIINAFPHSEAQATWRFPVGPGYCGPTVADGRVFVMDRQTEPSEVERIHCVDFATGNRIWSREYACSYTGIGYPAGPRASVTIDDQRAYCLGSRGHIHCLNVRDGTTVWQRDLDREYDISREDDTTRMPIWGIAASPLVVDNLVVLHIGGRDGACVVALNKATGQEVWRALDDRAQYSAPIVTEQAGKKIVVVWTGDSVAGLNLADGNVAWRHEMKPQRMPIGIASPIQHGDLVFVTSFYDGAMLLQLDRETASSEVIWRIRGQNEKRTKALHSIISTPIWLGDHIYGVDSYGEFRCLNAMTGDRVWEDRTATRRARWSTIHFVKHDDKVWMFNESGELIIARLSPQGYDEISRTKLIEPTTEQLRQRGGVCWSHPAFANGHVIVRNDKELACFDLRKQ